MKLKGLSSKRLSKTERMKKEKTLEHMDKTRQIDSNHLRNILEKKLEWAIKERQKGIILIKQNNIQVERLTGIVVFIQDLLNRKEKEKK